MQLRVQPRFGVQLVIPKPLNQALDQTVPTAIRRDTQLDRIVKANKPDGITFSIEEDTSTPVPNVSFTVFNQNTQVKRQYSLPQQEFNRRPHEVMLSVAGMVADAINFPY